MRRIAFLFTLKLGSKPVGIWLAFAALAWALGIELRATAAVGGRIEIFIGLPLLVGAFIALLSRRLIAVTLSGMALTAVVVCQAVFFCPFGIALAALGFIGLLANRRWFDEKLPRTGW
jgi:hypothetical protein